MRYWYWTVRVIVRVKVRVKMVQARYLVEVTVLAALKRKRWMPQVEMAVHLLARDVLKTFEGQAVIPAHDHVHERRVRKRGKPSLCWTETRCVSPVEWSALQE
jgi:hypothetical protein